MGAQDDTGGGTERTILVGGEEACAAPKDTGGGEGTCQTIPMGVRGPAEELDYTGGVRAAVRHQAAGRYRVNYRPFPVF